MFYFYFLVYHVFIIYFSIFLNFVAEIYALIKKNQQIIPLLTSIFVSTIETIGFVIIFGFVITLKTKNIIKKRWGVTTSVVLALLCIIQYVLIYFVYKAKKSDGESLFPENYFVCLSICSKCRKKQNQENNETKNAKEIKNEIKKMSKPLINDQLAPNYDHHDEDLQHKDNLSICGDHYNQDVPMTSVIVEQQKPQIENQENKEKIENNK
jgi:hypothetical protein